LVVHRTGPSGETAGKLVAAVLGNGDGIDLDDSHPDMVALKPRQWFKAVPPGRSAGIASGSLKSRSRRMMLSPKVVISVVAVAAVVGGGVTYLVKTRKDSKLVPVEDLPECITNFDASLRAYIAAGREGALDAQIVERLLEDLDAIKALSDEGNEVKISLDDLVPLFDMVIAHTSRLAEAYNVEVEDLNEQGASEDGVVVSLRRHLEAQKAILAEAS